MLGALCRLVDGRTECKLAGGVAGTPIKDVMGYGEAANPRSRNTVTMPKTKTDETDSRPADAAGASAGTPPGDLAHEINLLGAVRCSSPS